MKFVYTLTAAVAISTAATLLPANAQSLGNKQYIADEVAAMVGNSHILLSDIERTTVEILKLRQQNGVLTARPARDEAFETLLLQKMFAQQARADSLDKDLRGGIDAQVDTRIQELVRESGSVKALEKQYGKEIYSIKEDLLREAEDMQLSNMMQSNVMQKVGVTYAEVSKFLENIPMDSMEMMPEQYVYAQIVRMPPGTEERKFEVRQKLLEYRQRILDGESIGALARLYSLDPGTSRQGGEWGPGDINQLVYPIVEGLEGLKPGKVSEIIETEYGYHIVELISLKGNIVHFRQILLKPQFTLDETEKETQLLDSIAKTIGTDQHKFEEAVFMYSMDLETNQNGGTVFNLRAAKATFDTKYATSRFMKDALNPIDYNALSKLKPGEVSEPFQAMDDKGNVIHKIVRLNEIIPSHHANLREDYEIIADFALQDKQNRVLDKWIDKTVKKMYVWIAPDYRDYNLERNWLKK